MSDKGRKDVIRDVEGYLRRLRAQGVIPTFDSREAQFYDLLSEHPLVFDARGHASIAIREPFQEQLCKAFGQIAPETQEALLDAMRTGTVLTVPVVLYATSAYDLDRCCLCDQQVSFVTDGKMLVAQEACPYPNGIDPEVELNVPSGVLIVNDNLRGHFDIMGDYDIATPYGLARTTQATAEIGCAHGFVGNTCPGVYRQSGDTFLIASSGYDDVDHEILPPGERVAQIVTDLWWYSIVDEEEYVRRGCEGKYSVKKVRVKPGVYRFTHFYTSSREVKGQPTVFATFEWVRPPDPVKDYLSKYRQANYTAGQMIAGLLRRYATYGESADGIQSAANNLLCQGDERWHANGFPECFPDLPSDAPEVPIPVFDRPFRWSPLSPYSPLFKAAGMGRELIHLNPSFLALARNVLHCMITHGSPGSEKNVELAERFLQALNARYLASD